MNNIPKPNKVDKGGIRSKEINEALASCNIAMALTIVIIIIAILYIFPKY